MSQHTIAASATSAIVPVRRQQTSHRSHRRQVEVPRLSIVIVNYCQWDSTAALVRQILRTPEARQGLVEVVVVDNHSPRHVLAAKMRRWPGVSLRRWGRNRGFARAVNEGCRLSRGSWFLLLNPDMTIPDGFLKGVLARADLLAERNPRAGIVGFGLHNSNGSSQLSSGFFPTLLGTLAGLLMPRASRKYSSNPGGKYCRVPWATGCCLLIRRECLQELRGLDESFFLYYEDMDLCRRARSAGWSVWLDPAILAIHHNPSHSRPVTPALRLISRHSLLCYALRHWPPGQFAALASIVQLESWARQRWAKWHGNDKEAIVFGEMGKMASDISKGNMANAMRRVTGVGQGDDPRCFHATARSPLKPVKRTPCNSPL